MNPSIEKLQMRIDVLEQEIRNLKAATTIPKEIDGAFRTRLGIDDLVSLPTTTDKTAASETQAVSEGGAGSYNVAKPMDGFLLKIDGSTALYIPYYLA